jgi:hypothetical protein
MSDRDFFREVDEAVRQERYKALWDRYGLYALIAAALLVLGVAGYKGWNYWQDRQSAEAGAKFTEALALMDGSDSGKAKDILATLVAKGPAGYKTLARFQLAANDANAGKIDEAVAAYDALAADASVDQVLRGHATLQAATLRLGRADSAEMERRLKPLIDSGSAWKYSARALLGLTAYQQNNMREAERQFSALLGDSGTPTNLRETADMMIALIVGSPQSLSTTAK